MPSAFSFTYFATDIKAYSEANRNAVEVLLYKRQEDHHPLTYAPKSPLRVRFMRLAAFAQKELVRL